MDIEKYYSNFFSGTKDPSLDAMNFFMDKLGHPEKKLKFVHIAGTNGKGSTTEMISNILIDAGYKVGKYMTPQLIKLNERTSINNINITDAEFEALIKKLDIYSSLINFYILYMANNHGGRRIGAGRPTKENQKEKLSVNKFDTPYAIPLLSKMYS